jgi:omega-6 fatty acid desaturase (delta-12 desaturase)
LVHGHQNNRRSDARDGGNRFCALVPSYRLRQAHAIVKENWGEYIKERKFTWEMMKDITDKCHLYEQNEFYQTFREFDANN